MLLLLLLEELEEDEDEEKAVLLLHVDLPKKLPPTNFYMNWTDCPASCLCNPKVASLYLEKPLFCCRTAIEKTYI